ncbi:MAG: DUF2382 domain-containing protein [Bryobacterales bacterium]|nr:DUF2382 domain-containing protein [Bryobacterales bacterium]MBV9398969.1 DUF2382 domain-containing protein [Bryobacterales bacterium]
MSEDQFNETTSTEQDRNEDGVVIPLYSEEISAEKRALTTSSVQVARITKEHEQIVNEMLARERVEVERRAIGKPVDTVPEIRHEGDTIIVPVIEEVLERRLILKEELRVRRVREERPHQERVIVRKQEAVVTRSPVDESRQRTE